MLYVEKTRTKENTFKASCVLATTWPGQSATKSESLSQVPNMGLSQRITEFGFEFPRKWVDKPSQEWPVQLRKYQGFCSVGKLSSKQGWSWPGQVQTGHVAAFSQTTVNDLNVNVINTPEELRSQVVLKTRSRLDEEMFEGGIFLGELAETAQFLRNPIKSLLNEFHNAFGKVSRNHKRRLYRHADALADAVVDTYLANQYALGPLIDDVNQALSIFDGSVLRAQKGVLKARAGGKRETYTNVPVNYSVQGFTCTGRRMVKNVQGYHGVIKYRIKPYMHDAAFLAAYGISPTQALHTAWEVIPLSFVFDRYANVGLYLDGMAPRPHLEILGECYSATAAISELTTVESCQDVWIGATGTILQPSMAKRIRKDMTRTVGTPIVPKLCWSPKLRTIAQTLDELSLLWARRPKVLRSTTYDML